MIPNPQIDPVIVSIGPLQVRWYGLMYVFGFVAAFFIIGYLAKRKKVRLLGDDLWDFIFYAMLGVIIGGRLGYCLFYSPTFYFAHPLEIFALWHGGMSFHGGFLGVLMGTYYYSLTKKVPFFNVADIVVAAAPIGLGLGRIGNFINGELYGRATDVPWCMVFPAGGNVCRHPSQLYEVLLEGFALFLILLAMNLWGKRRGVPFWSFFFFYGLFRFFVEFFREPDSNLGFIFGPLTMGQLLSLPMILLGAMFGGYLLLKRPAPPSKSPRPKKKGEKT